MMDNHQVPLLGMILMTLLAFPHLSLARLVLSVLNLEFNDLFSIENKKFIVI